MKILVVSQYFWPEQFRINDLVLTLKERGHQVRVMTGVPNYPTGRLFEGYSWWKKRRDSLEGIRIYRLPLFLRRRGKGWQLAFNYLSFVFFGCLLGPWLLRKHEFDLIFVYEPSPFTVGIPAILMRRLKKAPLLFWVQDLWPESLEAAGAVKSPWVLRMVGAVVKWIYHRIDLVLVQSRAFIEPAGAAGASARRIEYFPNWAESFYRPRPDEALPEGLEIPAGFRVMFAGNLGEAQALGTIIAAAARLRDEAAIHWLIVGDGRRKEWMQREARRAGVGEQLHFLGGFPAERMPALFAASHALLVTLKKDQVFDRTIPSKVQTYMACARPLVAALNGEGARVIAESRGGLAVGAEDDKGLAAAVLELYRMGAGEREGMGIRARNYYNAEFEKDLLIERLEGWMEKAVEEGRCES
ncbi:MAG: glycosyltransferase family 4 protein [Desulfurivibrionaceae bacterium]